MKNQTFGTRPLPRPFGGFVRDLVGIQAHLNPKAWEYATEDKAFLSAGRSVFSEYASGYRLLLSGLPLRCIGWDIAATASGPMLVEGNARWDPPNEDPRLLDVVLRLRREITTAA